MRALWLSMLVAFAAATAADHPRDYSKAIVGCWLGPRKFEVFHADGRWGIKRNEEASEDIRGRRWKVRGNKLMLTYPGDHGMETGTWTIISFSERKMVLETGGYKQEYTRYSADCQHET